MAGDLLTHTMYAVSSFCMTLAKKLVFFDFGGAAGGPGPALAYMTRLLSGQLWSRNRTRSKTLMFGRGFTWVRTYY